MSSGNNNTPENPYFSYVRESAGVDASPDWPSDPSTDCIVSLSRLALEQQNVGDRNPIVTLVDDPDQLSQKYGMVISRTCPRPGVYVEAFVYSVTADDYSTGQHVVWRKHIQVAMNESAETPSKEQIRSQAQEVQLDFQRDELVAIGAMARKAASVYEEAEKGTGNGRPDNFHAVELAIQEEHLDDMVEAAVVSDAYQEFEYNNDESIYEAGVTREALRMLRKYEHENPADKKRTSIAKWLKIEDTTYVVRADYTKRHFRSSQREVTRFQVLSQHEEGHNDSLDYPAGGDRAGHQGELTELTYDVANIFATMAKGTLLDGDDFDTVKRYRNRDDIEVRLRDASC